MKPPKKITFDRKEKITILAASASMLVFALLIKASGVSLEKIIIIQNQFLNVFFGGSAGFVSLQFISQLLLAMAFLSLALSFLSAYGAGKDRYQTGLVSGLISSAIVLILMPSAMSIFIALALIASFSYIVPLSSTYFAELKKWRLFRTGSNASGKALLVINIIIAVGIFVSISANSGFYQEVFRKDITATISSAALGTVNTDSPLIKEQISRRVEEMVDSSPMFQSYIEWLPILTALSIWIFLEILRSLVLSNITGLFTGVLLRRNR